MRRILTVFSGTVLVASFVVAPVVAAAEPGQQRPEKLLCAEGSPLCAETVDSLGYEGRYTGHDEPSVIFYSNSAGAGNNQQYQLVIPQDPPVPPRQDGSGGTFNFQNRIAFWFGLDLCDNQSAPEFTHAACVPNTDANIFDGADPTKADYIGRHPGTAFLELQFYPPGWAPFQNGISCDARKWCAAMAIFSLSLDMNNGVQNNTDCLNKVGLEPANFAFITRNGRPHAPAAPLDLSLESFTPNPGTDLFMNAGDRVTISVHDSPAGLVTAIQDRNTGQSGSMTASAANGFAQINFEPNAATCSQTPYTFRPMYSTSSEHTRVPWAAHSYNVAYSDEIGHFEYCANVNTEDGTCAGDPSDPGGPDADDVGCHTATESFRIRIDGCTGTDNDFDGVSYQRTWAGTGNPIRDLVTKPRSILFSSPTFNGGRNYDRVGFEADLARIEAADFGGQCDRLTGAGCVNPPPGTNFYPFFTTRNDAQAGCLWQEGGAGIPGTTNTFGGSSATAFGTQPFALVYAGPGFAPRFLFNNFRRIIPNNPCLNR